MSLVALRFDSCEHQHHVVQVHKVALAPSMLLAGISHGLYKQSVQSMVSLSSMIMIPDGFQRTWIFLDKIASLSTLACNMARCVYTPVMP